jgi:hypothetical protein
MLRWGIKVIVAILVIFAVVYAVRILMAELGLPHGVNVLVILLIGLVLLYVAIMYIGMPPRSPGSGNSDL